MSDPLINTNEWAKSLKPGDTITDGDIVLIRYIVDGVRMAADVNASLRASVDALSKTCASNDAELTSLREKLSELTSVEGNLYAVAIFSTKKGIFGKEIVLTAQAIRSEGEMAAVRRALNNLAERKPDYTPEMNVAALIPGDIQYHSKD